MDCEIFDMPLFRGSDASLVTRILRDFPGRFASYDKGDFIAMQNSVCRSIFLLCEGSVYAQMTSDEGKEFTLDTLSAPDVLASAFVFGTENIYPVTIIANSDCKMWVVSRDCLQELIEQDKVVLHNFLTVLSDHSLFLSRKIHEFALQTLSSRVVGYLQRNGMIQNLQEAAFILGVARPSLSRAIAQLVAQGVLCRADEGYVLSQAAVPGSAVSR